MSISEMIEGRTDEGGVIVPPVRATESFRFTEVIRATETIKASEAAHDTKEIAICPELKPAEAIRPSEAVEAVQPSSEVSEQRPAPPVEKPKVPKPVREATPSKRADPPKEIMRTLVVEDGHWPMLKGLSESFKDLDDDDPDELSAFKTIVPNDD